MITIHVSGDFKNTEKFFKRVFKSKRSIIERYAQKGVDALSRATPVDTGNTANSWEYEITEDKGGIRIDWNNTNVNQGQNIAILLQYGHGTRNGGYVIGRDYINPAIRSVFDDIADAVWKEITTG